jgi:hypothetical protein
LVILRGDSIESDIIDAIHKTNIEVTATKKGSQTTETFVNNLKVILPLIGSSPNNPAIIEMDGHISRINEQVIEMCRKYHTYFVLQPSHTSITHQPLDNGINALLQQTYNACYSSNMAINPNSQIDNAKRMRILVNALDILRKKKPEKLAINSRRVSLYLFICSV